MTGSDLGADPLQEIGRHSIVRVHDDEYLCGIQRFAIQVPGDGSALPFCPFIAFDDAGGFGGGRSAIGAAVCNDDGIDPVARIVLCLEVCDEVADDGGLVVSGDDDAHRAGLGGRRRGAVLPSPERHDRVVAGQSGDHRLWDGCEKP